MSIRLIMCFCLTALLLSCGGNDPMKEINALVSDGKVAQAKLKFQQWVEKEQDPNLERKFIKFCYEHNQYHDFRRGAQSYLSRYPDDKEVKNLQFDHYAKLATDAERMKDYELALEYIVSRLLNPDYAESSRWEERQTTILQKWFEKVKAEGDVNKQKKVLIAMKNLGFENLGKTLDPDLYKSIEDQAN